MPKRSAKTQRYVEYLDVACADPGPDARAVVQIGELNVTDCWSSDGHVFYVEAIDTAVTGFGDHRDGVVMDELRELLPEDV